VDEIDARSERALISLLRQLSAGPDDTSVVLCGMRDMRDCKTASL